MASTPTTRTKIAAAVIGGLSIAGLGAGTVGATTAQGPTPTTAAAPSTATTNGERIHRRGAWLESFATALGTTPDKVKAARKTAHEAVAGKDFASPKERRAAYLNAFAGALGVKEADIPKAATSALNAQLAAAVKNGKISQADADKITAAEQQGPKAVRDAVKEQLKTRALDRIATAVKNGKITQEQGDKLTARVNSGEPLRKIIRDIRKNRRGG